MRQRYFSDSLPDKTMYVLNQECGVGVFVVVGCGSLLLLFCFGVFFTLMRKTASGSLALFFRTPETTQQGY